MIWRHHIDIQSNLDGSNTQGTDENSSVRAIEVELCLNLNKGTTKKVRDIHGVRVIAVRAIEVQLYIYYPQQHLYFKQF